MHFIHSFIHSFLHPHHYYCCHYTDHINSYFQNLSLISIANSHPVRISQTPLQLIHLHPRIISQHRIYLRRTPRPCSLIPLLLIWANSPYQGLAIITHTAQVGGAMRGPCHCIDRGGVAGESGDGSCGEPNIKDHHLRRIHCYDCHYLRVLSVPC